MHDTAISTSPAFSEFAGLLARLAESAESPEPPSTEDTLADDVAHISYESALRAQRRDQAVRPDRVGIPISSRVASPGRPEVSGARERKSASITIRMSDADCDQLRRRATEAGLTVSGYLRSCAFEVESLRVQVKQAVADMRSKSSELRSDETKNRQVLRFWPFARS